MSHPVVRSLVVLALTAPLSACTFSTGTYGPSPSGPAPITVSGGGGGAPLPPAGTARGGIFVRGQVYDGVLSRNETHEYLVDMQAGDSLHVTVIGTTELGPAGEQCQEWGWEWRSPDNGQRWHVGNPGPLQLGDQITLPRTLEFDVNTGVPIGEQMAGRWALRVGAGPGCYRIRYRLSAR